MTTTNNLQYSYVSAQCGAGKTYALLKQLSQLDQKTVIAAPTIKLLEQMRSDLVSEFNYPSNRIKLFDSNNTSNLTTQLNGELKSDVYDSNYKQIFLVTHNALLRVTPESLAKWHLVIDEALSVTKATPIFLKKENRNVFLNFIKEFTQADFCNNSVLVKFKNTDEYKSDIADYNLLQEINELRRYDEFLFDKDFFDNNESQQIQYCACIMPSRFSQAKSVLMMSNCFTNTLIYKAWLAAGVVWTDVSNSLQLRKPKKPIKDRIKGYYCLPEHQQLTKSFITSNTEKMKDIVYKIDAHIMNNQYIYTVNNDFDAVLNMSGTKISSMAHGQNQYQMFHTAVWLAAMKPSPQEARMLERYFGISSAEIKSARESEMLYQTIMRTSLRDFDLDTDVVIYCADKSQISSLTDNYTYLDCGIEVTSSTRGQQKAAKIPTAAQNTKRNFELNLKKKQAGLPCKPITEKSYTKYQSVMAEYYPTKQSLYWNGIK